MGVAESDHLNEESQELISSAFYDAVARRARELWELRGRRDGHAQEDWLQAEAEIRLAEALSAEAEQHRAYLKVRVGNSVYVAEYHRGAGYVPGELKKGQRVAIRIEKDVMYLRLSRGRELAARIVERFTASQ